MRFVAPPRGQIDPAAFDKPPLSDWREFDALLRSAEWPDVDALNALRRDASTPRFVAQTRELRKRRTALRIAHRRARRDRHARKQLARSAQCVDLAALSASEARAQPRQMRRDRDRGTEKSHARAMRADAFRRSRRDRHRARSRSSCAHGTRTTGSICSGADATHGYGGEARAIVFGHALLEHALRPAQLLVGKALVIVDDAGNSMNRAPSRSSPSESAADICCAIRRNCVRCRCPGFRDGF